MKIIKNNILENKSAINFKYQRLSILFYNIHNHKKNNKLLSCLYLFSGKIIFSLTKEESLKKILKFLIKNKIYPKYIKRISDIDIKFDYFYIIEKLENRFLDKKNNLLFICTKDLLPLLIDNKCISDVKKKNIF